MGWHSSQPLSRSSRCYCWTGRSSGWGRRPKALMLVVMTSLSIGFATGCESTRVVFVSEDHPIRIGPDVKGKVYYLDPETGQWTLSNNRTRLPEGWFAVSPGDAE